MSRWALVRITNVLEVAIELRADEDLDDVQQEVMSNYSQGYSETSAHFLESESDIDSAKRHADEVLPLPKEG